MGRFNIPGYDGSDPPAPSDEFPAVEPPADCDPADGVGGCLAPLDDALGEWW